MVHRNGYHAPHSFVEAENRKEAVKLLRKMPMRLMDFPEVWSWHLLSTDKVWSSKQKTWVIEEVTSLS